jgi:hypothetical protein
MTTTIEKIPSNVCDYKITVQEEIIVKHADEPKKMTWDEAMEKFGPNGADPEWRLPSLDEVKRIAKHDTLIQGLYCENYWTCDCFNKKCAWRVRMFDSVYNTNTEMKHKPLNIRCVRR